MTFLSSLGMIFYPLPKIYLLFCVFVYCQRWVKKELQSLVFGTLVLVVVHTLLPCKATAGNRNDNIQQNL